MFRLYSVFAQVIGYGDEKKLTKSAMKTNRRNGGCSLGQQEQHNNYSKLTFEELVLLLIGTNTNSKLKKESNKTSVQIINL